MGQLHLGIIKKPMRGKLCNPFDGGVRVPKTRWKHHKSQDLTFLHRSYTQLFFSTQKTNIFWSIEKISNKKLGIFSKNYKKSTFSMKILWFPIDIFMFFHFSKNFTFFKIFFRSIKKYLFSELKKKVGYSFDVEKVDLPIYDVFSAFWAL